MCWLPGRSLQRFLKPPSWTATAFELLYRYVIILSLLNYFEINRPFYEFFSTVFTATSNLHTKRNGSTITDRKQTDREPNDSDWLRRAIIKIVFYSLSHLALTLTLWRKSCDETVGSRSVCRGQLTWLEIKPAILRDTVFCSSTKIFWHVFDKFFKKKIAWFFYCFWPTNHFGLAPPLILFVYSNWYYYAMLGNGKTIAIFNKRRNIYLYSNLSNRKSYLHKKVS